MVEWFQNMWQWVVEHKDQIVIFFTSGNFVGFIANIILLFKALKGVNNNTSSTNTLNSTIVENKKFTEKFNEINDKLNELTKLANTMEQLEESLLNKLGAMLEVQSLVYATIKDEPTRVAVLNILANAKYTETAQRAQLIKQLEELKSQLTSKNAEVIEDAVSTVNKAEELVNNTKPTVVQRY